MFKNYRRIIHGQNSKHTKNKQCQNKTNHTGPYFSEPV